ncbi:DUF3048 domain-containing protein [Paenibacillus antri]|nr:DUF3048 domain-containing protein [Paenibacillus antri]
MNVRRRKLQPLLLLMLLSLLAGCAGGAAPVEDPIEEDPVAETPETPGSEDVAEQPILPYTYPLTGLPAEELLTDRPVVVMVENSPAARPQTGLHEADLVYEVLAEGDITRFIAVYQSVKSEEIGPVRSIRPYFVQLGMEVDGILVHAGWSQEAMNLMVKHKLNHLDQVYGDHDYYWRDKSRKAPHNLYTSIELIRKGAEKKKFREAWTDPVVTFALPGAGGDAAVPKGDPADRVTIPYIGGYEVGYEYEAATKTYLRSMKGKPHTDKKTDARLSATNVLVVQAKHRIVDDVGRREVDVQGPGKGVLLQAGLKRDIVWELKNGVIRAYDKEGAITDIPLLPGKTWVQIVPDLSKVTFGAGT